MCVSSIAKKASSHLFGSKIANRSRSDYEWKKKWIMEWECVKKLREQKGAHRIWREREREREMSERHECWRWWSWKGGEILGWFTILNCNDKPWYLDCWMTWCVVHHIWQGAPQHTPIKRERRSKRRKSRRKAPGWDPCHVPSKDPKMWFSSFSTALTHILSPHSFPSSHSHPVLSSQ